MLRRQGILWPSARGFRHSYQHAWIAECIRNGDLEPARDYIAKAFKEAKKANAHTLLLSAEDFSTLPPPLMEQLFGILPPVEHRIVVYLRNAYEFVLSSLVEWAKHNELLKQVRLMPKGLGGLNYDAKVRRWEQVFGEDSVDVRSYDRERPKLVQSFLGSLGLDERLIDAGAATRVNASPDPALMFLFHLIGHIPDIPAYQEWDSLYRRNFPQGSPRWPGLVELADIVVSQVNTDYKHPKLVSMRDELLRRPETSITQEERLDYLCRLRGLLDDMIASG